MKIENKKEDGRFYISRKQIRIINLLIEKPFLTEAELLKKFFYSNRVGSPKVALQCTMRRLSKYFPVKFKEVTANHNRKSSYTYKERIYYLGK